MSVWDDIADDREEAENLKVRASLMRAIRDRVADMGWSQTVAADNLGLTQPRVSDLFRGKISKFSLDALVDIASRVGVHVRVEVDEACAHA
ncbi:helix-turn-helix domain-containing protein [Mycobacterium intracellulare]|uniref:helix-turn-helix domain-containing protein n=1 Tax=Mycobacterium intracellulare TaxID=1767 RepID=UPI000CE32A64|nr:XRE family transcriptional regulator [Mycobacterium intracellulare]